MTIRITYRLFLRIIYFLSINNRSILDRQISVLGDSTFPVFSTIGIVQK